MLWISSLTLVVCFPGMYTPTVRLMHALPKLAQYLGGSEEKFEREEVLDWPPKCRSTEPLCWAHCCILVKHGQSTSAMPGNWIVSIWTVLGRFWGSPGRIRYQILKSLLKLNCQAFKLCFREHNSNGLATLFECKMYAYQKDCFIENYHGAGNRMVARRNDTRTLSRSLSRTLDLTVQHGRH